MQTWSKCNCPIQCKKANGQISVRIPLVKVACKKPTFAGEKKTVSRLDCYNCLMDK